MRRLRFLVAAASFLAGVIAGLAVPPVEFRFRLVYPAKDPFAEELWAEVRGPSGQSETLPAFVIAADTYAVRARAEAVGAYELGQVSGPTPARAVAIEPVTPRRVVVEQRETLPAVTRARDGEPRLVLATGETYVPVGANLAWPELGGADGEIAGIEAFGRESLNWMRVWMTHWSGLNLDWSVRGPEASPAPGEIDLAVAANWDRIVAAAEANGVYLQIVLQHHGQYATTVNANWDQNPWNAAHARGFLREPGEFFTSARALELTARKYRYIAARWGYSPAVLAWELFNEVHWTDPIELRHDPSTVASWHDRIAARLRAADPYHHLVTTSTEDLASPIYRSMDYFQPHNYPVEPLVGMLRFGTDPARLDRPVFFGEMGDDHAAFSPEQAASGVGIVPPVWPSVMGAGRWPAQPWLGAELIQKGRLRELGAFARVVRATGLVAEPGLASFIPEIRGGPLQLQFISAGHNWQRRPSPEVTIPSGGEIDPAWANLPRHLVSARNARDDGFPDHASYRMNFPEPVTVGFQVTDVGAKGGALRATLDGTSVAEATWGPANKRQAGSLPAAYHVSIPAGPHVLTIANAAEADWIEVPGLEVGRSVPVLAAVGRRSERRVVVWVWHRTGALAFPTPAPATDATLVIPDLPAGTWQVTWWDSVNGQPETPQRLEHAGGAARLPIPPTSRHRLVTLSR